MSRVQSRGRLWGRTVFELSTTEQGVCPQCGGSGRVVEEIDEERFEMPVFCPRCMRFCGTCKKWVVRDKHECREKK